eukprot:165489-Rhodomonas_salina.1
MQSSTTASVQSAVSNAATACVVLQMATIVISRAGAESYVLLSSAKFMFASSLQGTFDGLRGGAILLQLLGLAIAYSLLRT